MKAWCWKVVKGCVLTKALLHSRGMALNSTCQHCNDGDDDLHHLVLQCPWSIAVLQEVECVCGLQLSSLQSNTWCEWLRKLSRSKDDGVRRKLCCMLCGLMVERWWRA